MLVVGNQVDFWKCVKTNVETVINSETASWFVLGTNHFLETFGNKWFYIDTSTIAAMKIPRNVFSILESKHWYLYSHKYIKL